MVIFSVFVPGNVASSKNSKIWTGSRLVHSKVATKYINKTSKIWSNRLVQEAFANGLNKVEPPYKLQFTLIRKDKRRFDYVNMIQLPLDLMVKHGLLEDDNAKIVIPSFKPFKIDKDNSGVIISLIKDND